MTKNYIFNLISNHTFFQHISKEEIHSVINSSSCCIKTFDSKINIYKAGEKIQSVGIILDGIVDIIHTSINGDETIVNRLTKGHTFGNCFSCVSNINNLNDIRSITFSTILFIDIYNLLKDSNFSYEFRINLFENIMSSLAQTNIALNTKIQILSQKTLRDKLITYFELLSIQNGSNKITIPFNREQLACYLGSERSSVCRELSKLKYDNIININKNNIVLLNQNIS
ncbi:Crp/Fnr family transcriptional regulator [Romboutsia lituseburensis]|uniref:cAMP-binding domain of CRP or a regulatory subunit of cAMP-dependent protein kinases n=1 Tax=Romboutsia lituseburensis DSM 797 TaxID=1121325 RepID=A0A1G9MMA9_9FIRM|nr:Crp/Fnr family transcriptional regulator [Romboutsia lituseburensis]CEH34415.1 helix_turn_helix, cAMP Regulatory protein [Romboutsia lituseburensis]SDL74785.1 cAMP-binding domain of CRP or a regulatory subunit of cAMP-dependent protein kinases [Romboutsia lituseburensis DSM 797]